MFEFYMNWRLMSSGFWMDCGGAEDGFKREIIWGMDEWYQTWKAQNKGNGKANPTYFTSDINLWGMDIGFLEKIKLDILLYLRKYAV